LIGVGALTTVAISLASCATPPEGLGGGATGDFTGCLVTGVGQGTSDGSFNQLSFEGLNAAIDQLGGEALVAESPSEDAYGPNVANFADSGCRITVGVGYDLADAIRKTAELRPDVNFAIVDDDSIKLDNVKPITFASNQAAFLAGYAAASYSKSGVVGTYGGMQIPPVTVFMDGFADGIEYYNDQKGTDVQLVGWDPEAQTGTFTGGFDSNEVAKNTAASIVDQRADVLLPVGGPIFMAAAEAIRDSGKDVALIGVDADLADSHPDLADLFLTSILKDADVAVEDVVLATADGEFSSEPYLGTLENGAVSLAPFHEFEGRVSKDLQGELDAISAGIIDGSIQVGK
jgi:basic membrane protein A